MTQNIDVALVPWKEQIDEKLQEAEFFLDQMKREEAADRFRFYTSAFFTAARKPQQYLLEAWALQVPGPTGRTIVNRVPKAWYDAAVSARPVLGALVTEAKTADYISGKGIGKDKLTGVAEEAVVNLRGLVNEAVELGHLS